MIKNIPIIIVTYNPSDNNIKTINMNSNDFIIVDNSESIKLDLNKYIINPNLIYILKNNDNLGIAKALNIGCQFALDNGYKWLITMDQDSIITYDIIQQMIDFANKSSQINNIAIISPRHIMQDDIKVKVVNEEAEFSEGISTMTSGNLLNLEIWQKLGGFRDDLFIDMVDVDYYCKSILHGYRVITLNHLYMKHMLGNLRVKKILGKQIKIYSHSYIRKYYQVRNGLIIYKRYRKLIPQIGIVGKFLINMLVTLPFEEDRLRKLKYMLKGFIDFVNNKTGKLYV